MREQRQERREGEFQMRAGQKLSQTTQRHKTGERQSQAREGKKPNQTAQKPEKRGEMLMTMRGENNGEGL